MIANNLINLQINNIFINNLLVIEIEINRIIQYIEGDY